jgi:DNA-binding NtrC family response regulator
MMFRDHATFLSGPSAAISRLLGQIRYVAPYFRTALLTGEQHCGQEAVARQLHRLSPLANRPFLEITPAEVELRFNGTLPFGSSITEGLIYLPQPELLSPAAQAALLRMLRERGSQAPRIVAYAEHGIRSLVTTGTFSPELADSLGALRVPLPSLRDRTEDIPGLMSAMIRDQAEDRAIRLPEIGDDLLASSAKELWPGNFEQLRSVALALLQRTASQVLHTSDLQAVLTSLPKPELRERRSIRLVTLDQVIHEHIHAVLFACKGNKLRAAEILGISRSTLYRMLGTLPSEGVLDKNQADTADSRSLHPALRIAS